MQATPLSLYILAAVIALQWLGFVAVLYVVARLERRRHADMLAAVTDSLEAIGDSLRIPSTAAAAILETHRGLGPIARSLIEGAGR